ncbi:cobalamin-binding protein [Azotobacter vinelandii]|uniref:cobalamin-binding protein n=1 Tax=Azotobacter vinelandii TaxID=354 RepID=UPI0007730162|nr:cobalamin-binding protein [Azotobacter vinelandii]
MARTTGPDRRVGAPAVGLRHLCAVLLLCFALPLVAAERVVSLAPSLTESMLELQAGDRLVGVLDGGERPAALAGLPSLGRWGRLEMETLLALRPDLILLWPDSISAAQREQLRGFGIPVFEAQPRRLEDIATQLEALGERVGRAERGRELAAQLRRQLDELRRHYRREAPLRVFYQVWDRPLYSIGGPQIISDALRVCGAVNLFADLDLPAPQLSVEAVLARDPEVILVSQPEQRDAWQAWPQLQAVRRGQVWAVPDRGLERPSPQMLAATRKLCELLHRVP